MCTKDGAVPQGACTSTYVANLAFFEFEPRLVRSLKEQGLVYSRLIDDITISSQRPISQKRIEKIIEQVSKMLNYHGFTLKRKKTKITSASNPESLMEVTGLWLNRGHPRVKREERASIRKDVRSCVAQGAFDRYDEEYHAFHEKVSGRLSKLAQLKHSEAELFRRMMRSVLPLYNAAATKKTKALVAGVRKTPIKTRASRAYIERFHKIMYRLNILARNQPELAAELRSKMRRFAPTQNVEEAIHG